MCDLDGTVWLDGHPLPGAVEAIATARSLGHRVLFATNNSSSRPDEIVARLERVGIAAKGDVVSSADAIGHLIQPGERVYVIGGTGIRNSVTQHGGKLVNSADADVVAVGRDVTFDFSKLTIANRAIRSGARFVASNDDLTFPTPDGLAPGVGAILAAITASTGQKPEVAGKPYLPMAEVLRAELGRDMRNTVVIGDLQATDGLFAQIIGVPFVLVLCGLTSSAEGLVPRPEFVVADVADFVATYLAPVAARLTA